MLVFCLFFFQIYIHFRPFYVYGDSVIQIMVVLMFQLKAAGLQVKLPSAETPRQVWSCHILIFMFIFYSKYEDDDSDDEEAAKRMEVDNIT